MGLDKVESSRPELTDAQVVVSGGRGLMGPANFSMLKELAGKPLPESFGTVITPMGEYDAPLLATKRKFKQHGQSGLWISDWLPHIATCADDLCVIRIIEQSFDDGFAGLREAACSQSIREARDEWDLMLKAWVLPIDGDLPQQRQRFGHHGGRPV